jgi:peptidyl-prolyl cis-trans isomerase A (cyclophilin A)
MFRILATTLLLAATVAEAQSAPRKSSTSTWMKKAKQGKDLYATFKTSQGDIVVRLFPKDAPKTVENFVGLASGEKQWTHPQSGEKAKKPLYNGTVFHRVIPDFMIQGGDPSGTGRGHPGFRFNDEFKSGRTFDKPGLLAMANSGPNTNGSQFFITTAAVGWLNERHTIFGEVIQGYEVAVAISQVPRDPMDRPLTPVTLTAVELSDKAPNTAGPAVPAPAAKQ